MATKFDKEGLKGDCFPLREQDPAKSCFHTDPHKFQAMMDRWLISKGIQEGFVSLLRSSILRDINWAS